MSNKSLSAFRMHAPEKLYSYICQRYVSQINWDLLKSCLNNDPPPPKLDPLPRGFRLIDVENQNIVRIWSPSDYVCLSYVWGDIKRFQATTQNIGQLAKFGALKSRELPATIRDAMIACQRLGQRYLWVDRLCIIQDDATGTKQSHIDEMGRIYNHAFITLVAHEGDSADYGLHGVSVKIEPWTKRNDISVTFRSVQWASRGWTYQEAVLSRRLIYFAAEDAIFDSKKSRSLQPSKHPSTAIRRFVVYHDDVSYNQAVENYSLRELSDQGDTVNAFSGVCNQLFGKDHLFGLPTVGFDDAIGWRCVSSSAKQRCDFPSWSWASVKGPIKYPDFESPLIAVASWAFVGTDQHGNISMTWPAPHDFSFKNKNSFSQDRYWHSLQMAAAIESCKHGCMLKTPPEITGMDWSSPTFQNDFIAQWPSNARFWEACRGITPYQSQPVHLSMFSEQQIQLASKHERILAVSQTAKLSVRYPGKGFSTKVGFYWIHDKIAIGAGHFDLPFEQEAPCEVRFLALGCSFESVPFSFLSWMMLDPPYHLHHGYKQSITVGEHDDVVRATAVVKVLAIKTAGEAGVYRRIGFGFVVLKSWAELQPEQRAFVLE